MNANALKEIVELVKREHKGITIFVEGEQDPVKMLNISTMTVDVKKKTLTYKRATIDDWTRVVDVDKISWVIYS